MHYIFFALIILGVFISFKNWRAGLYWIIVVAALQDPVRKMTPGAPSFFVLSTLPIWIAVFLNVWGKERKTIVLFRRLFNSLRNFSLLFLLTLIPGAIVMLSIGLDTIGAVLLGAFSYIGPMIGVLVGFVFLRDKQSILRLLSFYCLVTAVLLIGTPLEYFHIFSELKALGTSVLGMQWIKYVTSGVTIYMKAGFFRSPDIMGWHAATMTILSIILFLHGRSLLFPRWFCLVLAVWGALCIVLSGRYKMIGTTFAWGIIFSVILFYVRKKRKIVSLVIIACLAIAGMQIVFKEAGFDEGFLLYAASPISYSTERLEKHGAGTVLTTFSQSGFWGRGLGSATQGARHTGKVAKGWQEGGAAKLIAELGVPGTIAFIVLVLFLLRSIFFVIQLSSKSSEIIYWNYGLLSLFLANGISFIVSYQVFGDPYILILISFFLGVALSAPRLIYFDQNNISYRATENVQPFSRQLNYAPRVYGR